MIEISVIIPTYNRKNRLKKALQSALAQTGVVFEVIVIDDGSTDDTESMIASYFPSVNYYKFENQGPAAARNRGIEKARGKWVAFLDSDDEWLENKLFTQLEFLKQNPEFPICQTEEIWIRKGKRVNPMKKHQKLGGWIYEKCLPLCIISPSAVMIHRELFDEVGLFDESFPACEDYDLWLRIAAKHPIGLIEKPYVTRYGGHEDQRSQEFPAMDRFRIKALSKMILSDKLNEDQIKMTVRMLEAKANIYLQGAQKRNQSENITEMKDLIDRTMQKLS